MEFSCSRKIALGSAFAVGAVAGTVLSIACPAIIAAIGLVGAVFLPINLGIVCLIFTACVIRCCDDSNRKMTAIWASTNN